MLERLTRGNHGIAFVVFQRTFENIKGSGDHLGLDVIRVLFRGVGHHRSVGGSLHITFFQAAAHEIGVRLARLSCFDDGFIGGQPIPFGACQVSVGSQFGLTGVVSAHHLAAFGSGLDHHFGAVHVHGEHVHALICQAVGGFCFFDGHGPVTCKDHTARDPGFDRASAHQESIDVSQNLWNGFGRYETDLAAFGHVASHHPIEVLTLINVTKKAPHIFRVLTLGPQTSAVRKTDIRIFWGYSQNMRVKVSEGRREQQRSSILRNHPAHGFLHRSCFRDVFFFHHFDARDFFQFSSSLGMGLVIAKVIARAHINHTHGQCFLCQSQ